MYLDLDTFLTLVYTLVDDLYRDFLVAHKPHRPGPHATLSDSEVMTLVLCAQWFPWSERFFLEYARKEWLRYFPHLVSQSDFNRRVRDCVGALLRIALLVGKQLASLASLYQVVDTVPVPLMRRCRGERHRVFGTEIAAIGRGGSDKEWYYGCKLAVATTAEGVITGVLLAPANTADQWLMEGLVTWRVSPYQEPWTTEDLPPSHRRGGQRTGPTGRMWPRDGVGAFWHGPYLADEGFRGVAWRDHWLKDCGAQVITPSRWIGKEAHKARRRMAARRQIVEQVNGCLLDVFHLAFCRARTTVGLLARVAAKVAAFNIGQWVNTHFNRPRFALRALCP